VKERIVADSYKFSEDFLRGLEARDFDVHLLEQLASLTSDQRVELAELLMQRKLRRSQQN